jgi:hypothetical protein
MALGPYDIGEAVTISVAFTVSGVATDPSTVTFTYRTPDGVETVLTYGVNNQVIRDAVGNYHLVLTAAQAGSTTYVWTSTGTVVAAISGSFFVRRQEA